jgi:hypothetical protein
VPARIVEVVPSAEEGSRSVRVRFELPDLVGLLPGMSGSVQLAVGRRRAVVLPGRALVRIGQLVFADVIEKDGVIRRLVRTGLRLPDGAVEIQDGVRPGETVRLGEAEAGLGR